MTNIVTVLMIGLAVLLQACAATSLPLATPAGADAAVATHNAEGMEHYTMGHWDVAKRHFEAAVQANPQAAEPHYNLALTLDKLGDHAGATNHFKKAAELDPNNSAITESSAYLNHVETPRRSRGGVGGYSPAMGGY